MEDKQQQRKNHPRQTASLLSKLFFLWTIPLFIKGFKNTITEDDVPQNLNSHEAKLLGDKLEEEWNKQKNFNNPSLRKALIVVFWKEGLFYGLLFLFSEILLRVPQPLYIAKFLSFYTSKEANKSENLKYVYASLIVLTSFFYIIIGHTYTLELNQLGIKMRVACSCLIYRKSLKLSSFNMAKTSIGQVVNLLSNDVGRFDLVMVRFHNLWIAPLETCIIGYLLLTNLGLSSLTGIVIMVLFIICQGDLAKKISDLRLKTNLKTDQRVRLINEIISGIQVIKICSWELPFNNLMQQARQLEIRHIRKMTNVSIINISLVLILIKLVNYVCILAYFLMGNQINAQYVFTMIAFYGILRQVISSFLPQAITHISQCKVSIERIQTFLLLPEIEAKPRQLDNEICVSLKNVAAKWSTSPENTLHNINLHVDQKELVAIAGTIGSGKSSLINVILQELPLCEGDLSVGGKISYVSQQAWIFNGTIKQNILFGEVMNIKRYWEVIRVCALEKDLNLLPYSDSTFVGERGIKLSGGQKARINLARAVYKDADIYLLDDPLSAVDAHIGKQLFDDCILGFLSGKCVILVTHQIQYLKTVNKIYVMEKGRIRVEGSFYELLKSGQDFLSLSSENYKNEDSLNESKEEEDLSESENHENAVNNSLLTKKPKEEKEQRNSGIVASNVYRKYILAGGGYFQFYFLCTLYILTQFGVSLSDYFLTFWVNLEEKMYQEPEGNFLSIYITNLTNETCMIIYSSIMIFFVIITVIRSFFSFKFGLKAAVTLHKNMFSSVIKAPIQFFSSNSSGQILNRFSKDITDIDENIPKNIIDSLQIAFYVFGIIILVIVVNPKNLVPIIGIMVVFYLQRMVYAATSRNLKRIESTTRSPIFSHIVATLQGLPTIHAFSVQNVLSAEFDGHQDLHTTVEYLFLSCNRCLGIWLDMDSIIFISTVILGFIFFENESSRGNVGLGITQSVTITGLLQWGIRQWSDLENNMTSVERVLKYTEVVPEKDNPMITLPKFWPEYGKIEFQSVFLKYDETEPFILKNLTFTINSREKIGIVGRTGAGKTSLISALCRLVHINGKILVDSINTKKISLKDLRSKIAVIPQEPILFSGSLRKNLDPFEEFQDSQLWEALDGVELKNYVAQLPLGLFNKVFEGGSNFSIGQRQLLCLARAMVQNSKILVLDEATANVDPQTDELIQKTIRKKFRDCTVLTIAHRLHTVMDSDRILVMENGQIVQFDHPYLLLQDPKGVFYKLVSKTGKSMFESLLKVAENNYKNSNFGAEKYD